MGTKVKQLDITYLNSQTEKLGLYTVYTIDISINLKLILQVTPLNLGTLMCKKAHMETNQTDSREGRWG